MPESSTAQAMSSHFTLNSARAASPLTAGTDLSSAGIARRLSDTCQMTGFPMGGSARIRSKTSLRRPTTSPALDNCSRAPPTPFPESEGALPAHRITPASATYRSNAVKLPKRAASSS